MFLVKEKKRLAQTMQANISSHEGDEMTTQHVDANGQVVTKPVQEKDRMKELIKKTIKSVAMYNSQLQKEVRDERRKCFDLQTMVSRLAYLTYLLKK